VIARIDPAYTEVKLAIDADGFAYHAGRVDWERDRARRNALTSRGWRVLHATWDEVSTHPELLVQNVLRARDRLPE
jgi:very-short-patch-repair endonuclease